MVKLQKMVSNEKGTGLNQDRMTSWINRIERLIFGGIVLFGYSSLIVASYHCYPNAEDYEVVCPSRDMGLIKSITSSMVNYDGRYSTNFLHATNPLVFGFTGGYSVAVFLGIALINVGLFFFMRATKMVQGGYQAFLVSAFVSIIFMNSLLCYGTFYKMAGNFVYVYPNSFLLFFAGSLILHLRANEAAYNKMLFLCAAISLIFGIGFTELFLPFYSVILSGGALYTWLYRREVFWKLNGIFLTGLLCIIFFIVTPGVITRIGNISADVGDVSMVNVLVNSVGNFLRTIFSLIIKPSFTFGFLYMVLLYNTNAIVMKMTICRKVILKLSVLVVLVSFLMTLAYYLPKKDDINYPDKIYTPVIFLLTFTCFLFVSSVIRVPLIFRKQRVSSIVKIALLLAISTDLVFGNTYSAHLLKDYRSGKLSTFKTFMDSRIQILREKETENAAFKTVILPKLIEYPNTVYISTDSEDCRGSSKWNKFHEEYFRLDNVMVIEDTSKRFR